MITQEGYFYTFPCEPEAVSKKIDLTLESESAYSVLLEHVQTEQEVDVDVVQHLERTLNPVFVADLQICCMDSAYDLACADSDCGALESAVYVLHEPHLLCEGLADNGTLSATVNESLELYFVDFHFYVEHGCGDE